MLGGHGDAGDPAWLHFTTSKRAEATTGTAFPHSKDRLRTAVVASPRPAAPAAARVAAAALAAAGSATRRSEAEACCRCGWLSRC